MADVDSTKEGKSGVGNVAGDSSGLSEGQKLFSGKITPAAPSRMDTLLAEGARRANENAMRHREEMDAQGDAEQGVAGTDSHYQTPFRHLENRQDRAERKQR